MQGTFGWPSGPGGSAVDSIGNVFVADSQEGQIQKFDPNGGFLLKWGSFGTGAGQFWGPGDVAVDARGHVFSIEAGITNRVQKFDGSGNFITMWGHTGTGDGEFTNPYGIAVDATGDIYIADTGNGRVQKFNNNGAVLLKWASPAGYSWPYGVTTDPAGHVYVTFAAQRVVKFDSVGTYLAEWPTLGLSYDIATDGIGNFYVPETQFLVGTSTTAMFTSDGTLLARWGPAPPFLGNLVDPRGVSAGVLGNTISIYISDQQTTSVQKFTWTRTPVLSRSWSDLKRRYQK